MHFVGYLKQNYVKEDFCWEADNIAKTFSAFYGSQSIITVITGADKPSQCRPILVLQGPF